MDLETLKARHEELRALMQSVIDAAKAESRKLTDDEKADFDKFKAEAAEVRENVARLEELRAADGFEPVKNTATEDPSIGMDKKELRSYSLLRAIRAAVNKDWSDAGLELEASQAAAEKLPEQRGSFVVPHDVLMERRDLTKGTGTGDQIVGTDFRPQSFIDLLRNRMVVREAGATVIDGLVGDFAVPKHSTGTTAYWVTEDGAPTESASAFTQVTMTPKTVAAYEDISRLLLKQSTPAAEDLVRNDMAKSLAIAMDLAALHGTGSNYQPTGIAATSGIGSVAGGANGAAPDWADIVGLETAVAIDNADVGEMAYVTNAAVRGKLKTTDKASGAAQFIWGAGGEMNGYRALVSNQVSSTLTKGTSTAVCSAIFFGAWSNLLIGLWGGLDLLVDPYSLSTKGQIRLVAFQSCDIAVRYAQAFSAMLDALTA